MIPDAARKLSQMNADLLLELRVGRSGLGDDWIYTYEGGKWTQVGRYLEVSVVVFRFDLSIDCCEICLGRQQYVMRMYSSRWRLTSD